MKIRNNDTLAVMGLWAACYPLITIGLPYAPHLIFAARRAALARGALLLVEALIRTFTARRQDLGLVMRRRFWRDNARLSRHVPRHGVCGAGVCNCDCKRTTPDSGRLGVCGVERTTWTARIITIKK
jgi:hypothetical protein